MAFSGFKSSLSVRGVLSLGACAILAFAEPLCLADSGAPRLLAPEELQIKSNENALDTWKGLEKRADSSGLDGDLSQAAALYLKALELSKSKGLPAEFQYRSLKNLGLLYLRMKNYRLAKAYLREAVGLESSALGKNSQFIDPLLSALGLIARVECDKNEELKLLTRIFEIRKQALATTHPDYQNLVMRLVELNLQMQKWTAALKFLGLALPLRNDSHPDKAQLLWDTGMVFEQLADKAKAESYYRNAMDLAEKLASSHHLQVSQQIARQAQNSLISVLLKQGKKEQAEKEKQRQLQADMSLSMKGQDPAAIDAAALKQGLYQKAQEAVSSQKAEEAIPALESLLQKLDPNEPEDQSQVLYASHYLGYFYYLKGELPKAESYSLESFSLRKKLKNFDASMTNNLENLGNIYLAWNKAKDAEKYYRLAIENEKAHPRDKICLAIDFYYLGLTLNAQDRAKDALKAFQQSAELAESRPQKHPFQEQIRKTLQEQGLKTGKPKG